MTSPPESKPSPRGSPDLSRPVQFLKGVGPPRAELLARLNLHTARDVLFFFPRDYRKPAARRAVADLVEGELAAVEGIVEEVDLRSSGGGRSVLGVLVRSGGDYLRAIWFNQAYLRQQFSRGQRVLLTGKPRMRGLRWEMPHPRVEPLEPDDEPEATEGIQPVYPLTEGLRQGQMRRIVSQVVEEYAAEIPEIMPESILAEHKLCPMGVALPQIHRPSDFEFLAQARRRFVFSELLVLQLALALRRRQNTVGRRAAPLPLSEEIDARIRRLFPFDFTAAQNQAIKEIATDMGRDFPMNRLLHGEVGSGKTVVAVYAMLLAAAHGRQAALMAPTEVLARQHYDTLTIALRESRVRMELLTGSLTPAQRRDALARLAEGEADLTIGTQAIVESAAEFSRLGLVVIDEQHKFGVRQRAALRKAGLDPHYLVMTATPIPRTMSMTLFGDLDVSTLRQPPPGRRRVNTYWAPESDRPKWWDFFRRKLREGRQGYVIAPLVDADEDAQIAGVEQTFESLTNGQLHEFRADLVHGRLRAEEKHAAMERFRTGQTQVLVATSVVEVGVDVPAATLMTIEDGQRFGLAQLHQLRGRVSRGEHPGYVCVFADPPSDEARRRLEAFVNMQDGFELAEIDFELRGPGDLFGDQQHGLPPLRIADLRRDAEILNEARQAASQLVEQDPGLAKAEHARLRSLVLARYGKSLELGDVG